MRTSSVHRTTAAMALVAGVIMLGASPASAVIRDTDPVKIAAPGGKADFGSGGHHLGAPDGSGRLSFDDLTDSPKNTIRVTLTGRVYWDDGSSGGCALVRMRIFSLSGAKLTTVYSEPVCRVGDGVVKSRSVSISSSQRRAHKVVIATLQSTTKNGPYDLVRSATRYYGEVNGHD